jgi:putative glycosyltransferase (TIGR04348 family)
MKGPCVTHDRKPTVVIVSPALADANNGNWQTARRWQQLLQSATPPGPRLSARIVRQWPDGPQAAKDDCMLALHARRSATSVLAWAQRHGLEQAMASTNALANLAAGANPVLLALSESDSALAAGLAVVLTGSDLYRDIQTDQAAQRSLVLAQRLVVLQDLGLQALPTELQARTQVIFQSTSQRQALPKSAHRFRALMVGHLREEKSPQTLWAVARLLGAKDGIYIDHIGSQLDPALAALAQATAAACPHYRWLGGLPHEATRRHIQRAHVLVHASRMEGGAHVVMEAVCSGTPVIASKIAGNVGMLGPDYGGYFDWNNAAQLLALLRRCQHDRDFYAQLQAQCTARAPLFAQEAEKRALHQLVDELLAGAPAGPRH